MPPRRDLLPAVTPLRFPAAFVVFLVHCWMFFKGTSPLPADVGHFHFAACVQFFFMLSGFILTYNYLDEFRSPTRRGVWNFYVARWARVYPVHVLTALAALPTTARVFRSGQIADPVTVTGVHALMLQAFVPVDSPAVNLFNGVSWSLSVECCFYLLLPLLIPALATGSRARRGLALAVVLSPWALATAAVCDGYALPVWIAPYRFPPVRMADFVAGILLGVLWHTQRAKGGAPMSSRKATFTEVAALAGLAVWAWACVRWSSGKAWEPAVSWIGLYLPPFAAVLWVFARGRGAVSRLVATKPLEYLGEISFAFYMFHIPVFQLAILYGWKVGFHKWDWPAQWLFVGAATAAVSVACYHLYEIPLRDRLRKRLSIKKPKPTPTEAVPDARRAA
jgi:peptidoglycan/LPS O-acetylase OafA/YrhL